MQVCADESVSGVVVASATLSHVAVVEECLRARKPVLVEKPVAPTVHQVSHLFQLAKEFDVPILCG